MGGCSPSVEVTVGDKSPKSKRRDAQQKNASKKEAASKAQAKRDKQGQQAPAKGK